MSNFLFIFLVLGFFDFEEMSFTIFLGFLFLLDEIGFFNFGDIDSGQVDFGGGAHHEGLIDSFERDPVEFERTSH